MNQKMHQNLYTTLICFFGTLLLCVALYLAQPINGYNGGNVTLILISLSLCGACVTKLDVHENIQIMGMIIGFVSAVSTFLLLLWGKPKKAFEFYGEDNQENLEKSEKQIKYTNF